MKSQGWIPLVSSSGDKDHVWSIESTVNIFLCGTKWEDKPISPSLEQLPGLHICKCPVVLLKKDQINKLIKWKSPPDHRIFVKAWSRHQKHPFLRSPLCQTQFPTQPERFPCRACVVTFAMLELSLDDSQLNSSRSVPVAQAVPQDLYDATEVLNVSPWRWMRGYRAARSVSPGSPVTTWQRNCWRFVPLWFLTEEIIGVDHIDQIQRLTPRPCLWNRAFLCCLFSCRVSEGAITWLKVGWFHMKRSFITPALQSEAGFAVVTNLDAANAGWRLFPYDACFQQSRFAWV